MNEAELRLELRAEDLEPAIGFWYPQHRTEVPLARAPDPAGSSLPALPLRHLFTEHPMVVSFMVA